MTDDATAAASAAAAASSAPAATGRPAVHDRDPVDATGPGCARLEPLLGANLLWFGRVLNRRFEALLGRQGGGITMAQARVLFTLDASGPITQRDLAARTEVEPPTLGRTINLMEREGLVLRRGNPGDRRQRLVELAAPGRQRIELLADLFEETEEWLTRGMPAGSVRRMVEQLSGLRERLTAEQGEEPCAGGSSGARRGRA